ncbi:MAG TPA: RNA polymerase sigma factor [Candidatus Binatia bacterium]|nr:RNA polymerase sigma factor [Candidatus Binatia bacterium]
MKQRIPLSLVSRRPADDGPDAQYESAEEGAPRAMRADDDALVARIVAGDGQAFELVMRRYNQLLFRAARSIVRTDADAEDVMQEAYVKAYRAMAGFQGRSSLATWLIRIVVNEAIGRARRQSRIVSIEAVASRDGDVADDVHARSSGWLGGAVRRPEQYAADIELGQLLSAAVDDLPDSLRSVFVLRSVEGMSVAETAAALDVSAEVVRARLHRARAMLRTKIDQGLREEARTLYSFGHERCDRIVALVLGRVRAG